MEKMTQHDWKRVGEAVVVWSGWGSSPFPRRDNVLVVQRYGADAAAELLPLVRKLVDEFYLSDARHVAINITEMAIMSSAQFRKQHPEISDDAVKALAWCYTFDYK